MTASTKVARVLQQGKESWLIGGEWTAGLSGNKPGDWLKTCKEQGFPARHTSVVWAELERQSAFFVFPDKPVKGRPLALLVTGRLGQGDVPWLGIFNLGECYWICGVDNNLAVSPRWERWGTQAEIDAILNDPENLGPLGIFRTNRVRIDDPQEAWKWLMESSIRAPMAVPANANQKLLIRGMVALAVMAAVGAGALEGWHWWQQKLAAERAAQLRAEALAQHAALLHSKAYLARQQSEMRQRLLDYWRTLPRPWEHAQAWPDFLRTCNRYALSLNPQWGWVPVRVTCRVQPGANTDTVQVIWSREGLATVKHLPAGAQWMGSRNDDQVETTQTLPGPDSSTPASRASVQSAALAPHAAVPPESDALSILRQWTSRSQQWAQSGVIQISARPFMAHVAPIPPFVPASERKSVHPPVLWEQATITLTGAWNPQAGWPLSESDFFPRSVQVDLQNPITWTITGVSYVANP